MDYGSSFAIGGSPLGHHDTTRHSVHAPVDVLPAPKPQRMHWSTMVFVAGMCICAIGLLMTVAGVPGDLAYDVDGAPNRNKPTSSDPMAINRSLDGNMKWIDQSSSSEQGGYVGYIKSINRSEVVIPPMVQALAAMDSSVRALDSGLAGMGEVTTKMGADMAAMADTSSASNDTMNALGGDIGFLSKSMLELAGSTEELTKRMAKIEKLAGGIAANGTSEALKNTKALNASLPDNVPVPTTSDGEPLDQAMKRLASGGGGTEGAGAIDGQVLAQ
ncbi:MAG: hypothetical protein JWL76_1097 [Thermoleophilia bacterium]|nr:hypothetical protein [Thermoleophilia bacterium]